MSGPDNGGKADRQSMNRGLLILIGGAEDKRNGKSVLKHTLAATQARRIVFIPTASAYPSEVYGDYRTAFRDLGVETIDCLDIRKHSEADREEHLAGIETADLVFFGGGDQARLVAVLSNTRLFARIRERFSEEGLHIAGTSAGAAAVGGLTIYCGDNKGFQKGSIRFREGFGLIKDVTVDTHFQNRKRIPRLSQFLVSGKCTRGIGLDENTGIVVYPNDQFEVIGTGMVTVLNSSRVAGSNYDAIGDGETLKFNNLKIGFLHEGIRFSLKKWAILN